MTAPPEHFADRPATPADLLRPPREFADPPAPEDAALGLDANGQPHDLLSELLPRGDPHHISDVGKYAHATVPARWLCGTFTIGDPQASHLLASLPAVIILRSARGPALEGLEVARKMLLFEMQSPSQGSAVMIARILDLLFIQILRAWAAGTDAEPNWLAGALDPQIGLALSAIHRDPATAGQSRNWPERAAFPGRRSPRGSSLAWGSRQPPISRTYAWTPPPTCSATPPSRSRSSRRTSATRRRRHSAARSSTATARHRLAGDKTHERNIRERPVRTAPLVRCRLR